jgi:hypothetical protein
MTGTATATTSTVACTSGTITVNDATHSVTGNTACSGAVTIPNSVTSIGPGAFFGATGLTSITFEPGGTSLSIGPSAFFGATGLTSVTIPNSATSIGTGAFFGATGLTSITIPNSVTSIGPSAFYGATGLTSVYFAGNAPATVGAGAFSGVAAGATAYRVFGATDGGVAWTTSPWKGLNLAYWMPPPPAPTAVKGIESATVTVSAPASVAVPTGYTVTAYAGAAASGTCTVTAASGSCVVAPLTAGTSYTFKATVTDGHETSAASSASPPVIPDAPAATPAPSATPAAPPATPAAPPATPVEATNAPALPGVATCVRGGGCTTTGTVPDGATRVVQIATGGDSQMAQMAFGARATARITNNCKITTKGTTRTYTCKAHLGAGTWTLTTQAKAGATVIAQSVKHVRVRAAKRTAVTG